MKAVIHVSGAKVTKDTMVATKSEPLRLEEHGKEQDLEDREKIEGPEQAEEDDWVWLTWLVGSSRHTS